jgi:DNA-binding winged helix-turn-helix (wHTH) protein
MHVRFDSFELDSERHLLVEGSQPVHLAPKAFRLLEVLVRNSPRAVAKQELHDAVWPQVFVEESNLAGLVAELRAALGDHPRDPRFIRTVHGFGYAFCGEIRDAKPRRVAAAVLYQGKEIPLFEGENILGRDRTADVQVDDRTVSRRHASITIDGTDHAVLTDLGSKNGTFLDGQTLSGSTPLLEGQTIVLGDARLVFQSMGPGSTITLHRSGDG